jgi:tetratricopeptide (TPR) repeat protein
MPAEQAVMQKISVFRGGFDRAAALEVAGASGPLLAALVEKSLLHLSPSGRYELHELLRQYAAEKLAANPADVETAQAQHGHYYTTFLARRAGPIKGPREQEILAEIVMELGNVRAAWQWAVQTGNLEVVEQALEAFFFFYMFKGWDQEWQIVSRQTSDGLAWLDETDPQQGRLKGRLLMCDCHAHNRMGYIEKGEALARHSLALLRQYGPPRDEGMALLSLNYTLSLKGEIAEAKRYSSEALQLFQSGDDLWYLAFGTGNRGLIAARQGEAGWAEAEHYLHLVESYIQKLGNPWLLSGLQRALGELYLRQGKLPAARHHFQTGLHLARQNHHRWEEVLSLAHLGQIAQQLGELEQTRLYCEACILAAHEIGDRYHLAKAHYHLGQVCQAEGALPQARQQFQTSLALRREIEDRPGIAASLQALAEVATALEQAEAAQQYRAEAQQVHASFPAEETQG